MRLIHGRLRYHWVQCACTAVYNTSFNVKPERGDPGHMWGIWLFRLKNFWSRIPLWDPKIWSNLIKYPPPSQWIKKINTFPTLHSLTKSESIHRMQIWWTTRSSPGTSYMKARLVSLQCFILKVLPQKTLALSSLGSVLFHCPYEFLCFWMRREGIEIFHLSPLRENSGSMQFIETEKRSSRPLAMFQERRSQKNRLNDELMWSLVASQHDFHGQNPPKVKKSSSWMISYVSKEEVIFVRVHSHGVARSKRMNFNCPVAETNESIEPNDKNLEVNRLVHIF